MLIAQIVPRLKPSIDGIGHYSLLLAKQLRKDHQIETKFIVGDSNWNGEPDIDGFEVKKLEKPLTNNLVDSLSDVNIALLQYIGYGFAKRGCPNWLVRGLGSWKNQNSNNKLITMFHELWAWGPPWTSSFWCHAIQKRITARLAQLSSHCLSSREKNVEIIQSLGSGQHQHISTVPIFSTIGEPQKILPLTERDKRLIVFGSATRRAAVYQNSTDLLGQISKKLEIREILDIGPELNVKPTLQGLTPITTLGQRSETEIVSLLQTSLAGVLDYPTALLAKSSIFAAYCAHGLIPVVTDNETSRSSTANEHDGLKAGQHYWFEPKEVDFESGQLLAARAHDWYQAHNIETAAKIYAELVCNNF